MKKLIGLFAEVGAGSVVLAGRALAVPASLQQGANDAAPQGSQTQISVVFKNVANTLIYIVGAIAVIMLIIGGLRYVLSGGSKDAVEGAKNTILYAIIGIVVAILAFAAVNFVIKQFQ